LCQKSIPFREQQESRVMNIFFQLWDTTTGNLVTEFDSEDEAIAALCSIRADEGIEPLLEFALLRFEDDRPTPIAKANDLVSYIAMTSRDSKAALGRTRVPN
jgi:hypothetical protein